MLGLLDEMPPCLLITRSYNSDIPLTVHTVYATEPIESLPPESQSHHLKRPPVAAFSLRFGGRSECSDSRGSAFMLVEAKQLSYSRQFSTRLGYRISPDLPRSNANIRFTSLLSLTTTILLAQLSVQLSGLLSKWTTPFCYIVKCPAPT